MPFINGRFYANPAYGRAVEHARTVDMVNRSPQRRGAFADVASWNDKQGSTAEGGRGDSSPAEASKDNKPEYQNPQNEAEARLANVVYNETSSLRPKASVSPGKPGSASNLQDARVAVAEVAHKVIKSGHPTRVAPSELTAAAVSALNSGNREAVQAHNDSLAAARQALNGSGTTNGATRYRLRSVPDIHTPIEGKNVIFHFGPFDDTSKKGGTRTVVIAP